MVKKKKALLNSITSVSSYLIFAVLNLYVRKLFLENFPLELLGYEGLFGSTFTILSMAEMGAGSFFTYRLYSAIQNDDKNEISVIMSMFKALYEIIGVFVAITGVVLYFFLPLIVHEEVSDWNYVRLVFLVQMLCSLSSYFLAYRRTLLIASQNEYCVVTIDSICRLVGVISKVIIILSIQSYVLYILITLFVNIASNLVVYIVCGKKHSYLKRVKVKQQDFAERGVGKELSNLLVHRVASTIYSSADNILITMLCGIEVESLFTNYLLVNTGVMSVIVKTLQPLEATFGNKICDGNIEENKKIFQTYDFFCKMLAVITAVGFSVIFQATIHIFYGAQYLLPLPAVIAIAANNYVTVSQYAIVAYRNGIGHYEVDRNSRIISALVNVVGSIVLGMLFGITGILLATVLGHFFIWYGRIKVVGTCYFKEKEFLKNLLKRELVYILTAIAETVVCWYVCTMIEISWIGLFARIFVCVFIPIVLSMVMFGNKVEYKEIKKLLLRRRVSKKAER